MAEASTSNMDNDPIPTTGVKRQRDIILDPDTGLPPPTTSKKARMEPDQAQKVKVLKFLLESYAQIHNSIFEAEKSDPDHRNINIAIEISNVLLTVFSRLRQGASEHESSAIRRGNKVMKTFSFMSRGVEYTLNVDTAISLMTKEASTQGLEFRQFATDDPENWYETALMYLAAFAVFGLRLEEIKQLPITMLKCDDGYKIPVSRYGLELNHWILLEGSCFPPETRSAIALSVGPMTAFLMHCTTKEPYREKWTNVCKRVMSHIPMIDEILEVSKSKSAYEMARITRSLGDLLTITTSGQVTQMCFPINMLYVVYKAACDAATGQIMKNDGETGMHTGYYGGEFLLKHFDLFGTGGFSLYKSASLYDFVLEGKYSVVQAQQVVFHGIFGTCKENLNLLASMSELKIWNNHKSFKDAFRHNTTSGFFVTFRPVALRMYSEMCSAVQTSLVFCPRKLQTYENDFFVQMGRGRGPGKTIQQIKAIMDLILEDLIEDIKRNGSVIESGTSPWFDMATLKPNEHGKVLTFSYMGEMQFFIGE